MLRTTPGFIAQKGLLSIILILNACEAKIDSVLQIISAAVGRSKRLNLGERELFSCSRENERSDRKGGVDLAALRATKRLKVSRRRNNINAACGYVTLESLEKGDLSSKKCLHSMPCERSKWQRVMLALPKPQRN